MIETQVQFTEEQMQRLRELAAERGLSVAEVVFRAAIASLGQSEGTDQAEKRRRALAIVGAFHSGKADISDRHDDYLDEGFGDCPSS